MNYIRASKETKDSLVHVSSPKFLERKRRQLSSLPTSLLLLLPVLIALDTIVRSTSHCKYRGFLVFIYFLPWTRVQNTSKCISPSPCRLLFSPSLEGLKSLHRRTTNRCRCPVICAAGAEPSHLLLPRYFRPVPSRFFCCPATSEFKYCAFCTLLHPFRSFSISLFCLSTLARSTVRAPFWNTLFNTSYLACTCNYAVNKYVTNRPRQNECTIRSTYDKVSKFDERDRHPTLASVWYVDSNATISTIPPPFESAQLALQSCTLD